MTRHVVPNWKSYIHQEPLPQMFLGQEQTRDEPVRTSAGEAYLSGDPARFPFSNRGKENLKPNIIFQ